METCLATEHDQECLHNPRWVEEDWSEERLHALQLERHAFECDAKFYSREQRMELSKRINHGHLCVRHSRYCAEHLHVLQMIRGDAISDLQEPITAGVRRSRVRTAAARAAKMRVVRAARSLTPEHGRQSQEDLRDELESTPSTRADRSESTATATSSGDSERSVSTASAPHPVTPQPASHQTSLERLMLLGHFQESEDKLRHLEHDAYASNDEIAGLRQKNAALREHNIQLKLEKVQQDQELIQVQDLLRSAGEQFLGFLAAKNR